MCGNRTPRAEMLQVIRSDLQRGMGVADLIQGGLDCALEQLGTALSAEIQNDLGRLHGIGCLLGQLGDEVISDQVDDRDVAKTADRIQRHFQVGDLGSAPG